MKNSHHCIKKGGEVWIFIIFQKFLRFWVSWGHIYQKKFRNLKFKIFARIAHSYYKGKTFHGINPKSHTNISFCQAKRIKRLGQFRPGSVCTCSLPVQFPEINLFSYVMKKESTNPSSSSWLDLVVYLQFGSAISRN